MPYSGASDTSLPSNVKKMPLSKRKQWVAIFNNTYNSCVDGGGSSQSCETKAFRIANGTLKKKREEMSWFDRLGEDLAKVFQTAFEEKDFYELVERKTVAPAKERTNGGNKVERALSIEFLVPKIMAALKEKEGKEEYWHYSLHRLMVDRGQMYAVFYKYGDGNLYRSNISLNGSVVTLSDLETVEEEYVPAQKNRVRVHRQKDGTYRITMIAATSVLNRDKEIDSTELFDNFIDHAETLDLRPEIDVYHLGSRSNEFDIGKVDLQTRVGVTYITSGIIDTKKKLGKALVRAFENGSEVEWGCSIEFYPVIGSIEKVALDDDTEAIVYRDGINTRVTILPEMDAASLFTRVYRGREETMALEITERQREALQAIFGNKDELEEFLKTVEDVNDEVVDRGLVHRGKDETEVMEEEAEEETEEEEVEGSLTGLIELDDGLIETIIREVAEKTNQNPLFEEIRGTLQDLSTQLKSLVEENKALTQRVKKLEAEEETKKKRWLSDLPASKEEPIFVTYSPSSKYRESGNGNGNGKEVEGEEISYQDRAQETLNNIPRPSTRRNQ